MKVRDFENNTKETITLLNGETSRINQSTLLGDKHHGLNVTYVKDSFNNEFIVKPRLSNGERMLAEIEEQIFSEMKLNLIKNEVLIQNNGLSVFKFIDSSQTENINCNNYFFNAGLRGAILYCFLFTDIHYENVIPTKNSPVIIDAETIFTSNGFDAKNGKTNYQLSIDFCSLARTGFFSSNFLFSPIINKRQINKLTNNGKARHLYESLTKFPLCDEYINDIYNGFFDGIHAIKKFVKLNLLDFLVSNIHELQSLRVILKPTRLYIDYISGVDKDKSKFNCSELEQLNNGDVPYFTHNDLNSDIHPQKIVKCINDLINYIDENQGVIRQEILRQAI